ncbi:DUF7351 domain-containing protein [Halorarius litoreus]|uniref:DUF7351 domain-containing protein n=1 Tax=Halorarius litoreus TaxID=2962676 RepID=UPI0020CF4545|nr:hypothetical protein [Halorarius litoreus]
MDRVSPADAFELLAAEPRMDILQSLVAARREGRTPLAFSTLRHDTAIDDSGRFNYHLGKLVGTFVEKSDDGYDLSYAGRAIVAAVIAGTYTDAEQKAPEPLDDDCVLCGAAVTASYDDGDLVVRCDEGHDLFVTGFPPGAAGTMDMATLLEVAALRTYQRIEFAMTGRCPECFSPLETTPTTADFGGGDMHVFEAQCAACGEGFTASAGTYLVLAPEVVAFYRDHGVDVHHERPWAVSVALDGRGVDTDGHGEATVVSTDPYRLRFDLSEGDDTLRVTLDGRGRVVEMQRPS